MVQFKVKNYINENSLCLKDYEDNQDVIEKFIESRYDILPVINSKKKLIGFIERKDIFKCLKDKEFCKMIDKDLSKVIIAKRETNIKEIVSNI